MEQIGKNIRALRQKQGWSQGEVAKRIKISIPAFSKIETGITDINISRLEQIATLFHVDVLQILSRPGDNVGNVNEEELGRCKQRLSQSEQEVVKLQSKLISLYDELRNMPD